MANEENLIPMNQRTESEAREIGRRGGIASGEARRKKKTLGDILTQLLELPCSDTDELVRDFPDVPPEEMTNLFSISAGLFKKAQKGDIKAIELIHNITDTSKAITPSDRPYESLNAEKLCEISKMIDGMRAE